MNEGVEAGVVLIVGKSGVPDALGVVIGVIVDTGVTAGVNTGDGPDVGGHGLGPIPPG